MSIYLSLFDDRSVKVAAALEALVAKDVRRALGMFGDIIVSPHIPTTQITSAVLGGEQRIQEYRIIRSLMRGRYKREEVTHWRGRSTTGGSIRLRPASVIWLTSGLSKVRNHLRWLRGA
jgi:hypothetical protein